MLAHMATPLPPPFARSPGLVCRRRVPPVWALLFGPLVLAFAVTLAVMLAPLSRRARVVALAAALVVALPYTLVLRVEQGYWSLTPKTALVHAPAADARAAEWRLHDASALPDTVGLGTRLVRDGGAIVRAWPERFAEQARRVSDAWPLPLLLLALLGFARREGRGPWLACLALPFVYQIGRAHV